MIQATAPSAARDQPARRRLPRAGARLGEESTLAQRDRLVAVEREVDDRVAGLADPAVGEVEDRLARRLAERAPEIIGGRVPLPVAAHVEADAVAEAILAEVALHHPQHGAPLLVGDGVERLAGLLGVGDVGADGVGGDERVERQRCPLAGLEVHPDPPRRAPVGDDLVGHPGGEGLVEPQVVPPGHRHQVAEPLVGELVRDHLGHPLLHGERRGGRIGEQRHLAEGDGAGVLHGAGLEVGDADLVELAERVGEAEVVLEPRQHRRRRLLREGREVALLVRGPGAHGDTAHVDRLAGHHRADHQRDEVGRQRRRRREADPPAAAAVVFIEDDHAVRDRGGPRGDAGDGHLPDGLEGRLVEAGEQPARVGGLELCDGEGAGAVQAAQPRAERAPVGDAELGRGRKVLRERQRDGLALGVRGRGRGARRPGGSAELGRGHLQPDAVERDDAPRAVQRQRDGHRPLEAIGVEVEAQVGVVPGRSGVRGETEVFSERHAILWVGWRERRVAGTTGGGNDVLP